MASKFVEGHIRYQESILNNVRHLITEQGETSEAVQQVIDEALDHLEGWYEMRKQFE